jgi:hypothetical protein
MVFCNPDSIADFVFLLILVVKKISASSYYCAAFESQVLYPYLLCMVPLRSRILLFSGTC